MVPITDPYSIIKKCIELFKNKNGNIDFVFLVVELDEYTLHFLNNGSIKYFEESGEVLLELNSNINEYIDTFEGIFSVFLVDLLIDNTEFLHETYIRDQDIFFGCVDKHIITKHELLIKLENQIIIKDRLNLIKQLQDTLAQQNELMNLEKAKKIPGLNQKELNDLIVANVSRNVPRAVSFGEILDETAKDIIDEPYYHHCENELSLNTELHFLLKKRKQINKIEEKSLNLYSGSLEFEINALELEILRTRTEHINVAGTNLYKTGINERNEKYFKKLGGVFKTVNRANRDLFSGENVSFGKTRSDISYLKGLKC
jgi:hypothetical protein